MQALRILTLWLLFLTAFLPPSLAGAERTVRVGWFEYGSFQHYNPLADPTHGKSQEDIPGAYSGYNYEYLKMIGEMAGWKYQFIRGTMAESIERLQHGDVDLIGCMTKYGDAAAAFSYPSNNSASSSLSLLVKGNDKRYALNGFSGFSGMRVGLILRSNEEYMLDELCQHHGFTINKSYYTDDMAAVQALEAGDIDAVMSSVLIAPADLKIIARMRSQKMYFVTSPAYPDLLQELDDAIERIKYLQPSYNEILTNKYFFSQASNGLSLTQQERDYLNTRIAENRPVLVSFDPAWIPIEYRDPQTGEFKGVMAEIFKRISHLTGLTFQFVSADTYAATTKEYDNQAELASTISTDFEWADQHNAYLTQTVFEVPVFVAYAPDHNKTNIIALPAGYHLAKAVIERLNKEEDSFEVRYYDTVEQCMDAVRREEAGRTYVNAYELNYYMNQSRYEKLSIQAVPGFFEPTSIGVSKEANPLLFDIICQALRSIPKAEINNIILNTTNVKTPFSFTNVFYAHPIGCVIGISIFMLLSGGLLFFYYNNRKNERLRLELEAASNAKSDFLSRMSHDIRTPMNAIIGLTEIARTDNKDPHIQSFLNKIHLSSKFLLDLINDILDLSKVESGSFTFHREAYALADFRAFLDSSLGEQARSKNIQFHVQFPADLTTIFVDRLRFNQVFVNLLNNAMKFTPPGGKVDFSIESGSRTDTHQHLLAKVADTGIGIHPEFLPHIFHPFDQEDETHVRTEQGTGLGLAIVKKIMDASGGEISVASEPGKGTVFSLLLKTQLPNQNSKEEKAQPKKGLPAHFAAAREKQTDTAAVTLETYRQLFADQHILVVEDNEINQEVVCQQLLQVGLQAELAANGREAIERFSAQPVYYFAAILMDIRMPVMGGIEASKRIRQLKRQDAASIPIIALTADAYAESREEILANGITAFLAKPIYPKDLYATLKRALDAGSESRH